MLDLQLIRDQPEPVRKAILEKNTGDPAVVDRLLDADRERRATLTALQTLQQQQGEISRQIGPLMKAGKRDEAAPLVERSNALKGEIQAKQETARTQEEAVQKLLLEVPNLPHPSVPIGRTPEDNVVAFEWGEKPAFDIEPKPHWELAALHGLIDFERGAKVTGAGFPFYVGKGARLQRALIQFFLDLALEGGYTEVQPPLLVNEASGVGTGQIPDKEGQMYRGAEFAAYPHGREATIHVGSALNDLYNVLDVLRRLPGVVRQRLSYDPNGNEPIREERDAPVVEALLRNEVGLSHERVLEIVSVLQWDDYEGMRDDDPALGRRTAERFITNHEWIDSLNRRLWSLEKLYLVPTAEVPVTNFLRDEIILEADLPIRYAAYTPCFRREAGSYGKDVRGLNRLHQFDKVELVRFVHPDESYDHLEQLRADAERAVQALGLPYRRLLMCTGDMGFTQAKKYDLEVWSAGQGRWLEVSSISNFEAFQARRANIRFRAEGGKPQFVHTLNGSALALPRTVAALLENGQQADGSIRIPEALHRYTGFDRIA